MRIRIVFILVFKGFLCMHTHAQVLKDANDTLSYSLGVLIGKNLKQGGYTDIDYDIFMDGMKASLAQQGMLLSDAQCESFMQEAANKVKMKQYESNRMAGEEFLAANKNRAGVATTESGIQYEILKTGDGPKPGPTDEVIVHYHGTLIDGVIFDSSVDRGESISFPLNRVIRGWTEILQLMPVGSKWKVYIPYDLAYGDRAAGPYIQPFSTLIFEIELLGIK